MPDRSPRLILYEKQTPPPGSSCMRQDWGLFPGGSSAIVETVWDTDETEATTQTRDRGAGGNTGTGQAFDFTRPPDPGDEVLRLWRRYHSGLQRTAMLGLPPPEDQCLARDRTANARSGIVLQLLSCPVAQAFQPATPTFLSASGRISHWLRLRRSVGQAPSPAPDPLVRFPDSSIDF